jgi:DNA-binding beta-propeller fold protein YncE
MRLRGAFGSAVLALGLLFAGAGAGASPATAADATASLRNVLLVGNSSDGTVSFLDGATFKNLGTLDVAPDKQALFDSWDIFRQAIHSIVVDQAKGEHLVDDAQISPDGRTVYVSRGTLGDAAAFDVATGKELWRTDIEGYKADHAALSPDGTRFVVSAIASAKAKVLDTATGAVVNEFATGTYPHENMYSADGKHIYNMSIGTVSLLKAFNFLKGAKQVTEVDATTYKVIKTYPFEYGVRPAVITPDETTMYAQLSYLNGFVEYDFATGAITRTVQMPFSTKAAALSPDDYPQNSAHHGMAFNGAKTKLCDVGTIDDYTAIVSRPALTTDGFVNYPTDALPYWATTSADGNYCFVTLSNLDQVSVVDYRTAKEVARIDVGDFPQRERLGKVDESALGGLTAP